MNNPLIFKVMYGRYTDRVKKIIHLARQEALRLHHDYIGPEHILLGMLREGEGVAAMTLTSLGLRLEEVRKAVEEAVGMGSATVTLGEIPLNEEAQVAFQYAREEAKALSHNYIGTEHLLLGILRDSHGLATQVLSSLGIDIEIVRNEVVRILGGQMSYSPRRSKSKTPLLDYFSRDLAKLAREEALDPIIGRDKEIERVVQILSRRKKNNPVLIGEAGVGKTAIVEGLAQRVVSGKVPPLLRNRRILALDMAAIVAGTKYRGQFEERMKGVVAEIVKSKNCVVFIDELHTIVGAGGAEGAIDASNILKPALARGELQCIGATTLEEYRRYIEKHSALERRFQPVMVDPPTVKETVEILKGLKEKYESHHKVLYTDEALEKATQLADRYISDRFLPDKAIDVIDEAGARVKLLRPVKDPELIKLEEEIEKKAKKKEEAVKNQEFENAARLRDGEESLREELRRKEKEWEEKGNYPKVTEGDITYVVSSWTSIPLSKLGEEETERLLKMEDELKKRIVGQDHTIQRIAKAIRRSRAGIKDPRRPIGSFIFMGPTGVGKTELARVLAGFLFDDENALVRLDMSEYMEKFNVSRLVGAPPGYVGYEEGGQLTEKVRRKPYSVVLFDEIEKAHPDVFNILLQILEDGQLTDSLGRKVDFKNTVVIMTSNIATAEIKKSQGIGFQSEEDVQSYEKMREMLLNEVKRVFRPEFLNRVDEIIVFKSLGKAEMGKIVDILVGDIKGRLKEEKIEILLTQEAKELLVEKGFDPEFGARPLKRALRQLLEDPLAEEMIKNPPGADAAIKIKRSGDALNFSMRKKRLKSTKLKK